MCIASKRLIIKNGGSNLYHFIVSIYRLEEESPHLLARYTIKQILDDGWLIACGSVACASDSII